MFPREPKRILVEKKILFTAEANFTNTLEHSVIFFGEHCLPQKMLFGSIKEVKPYSISVQDLTMYQTILLFAQRQLLPCVPKIVAFINKDIQMKIFASSFSEPGFKITTHTIVNLA